MRIIIDSDLSSQVNNFREEIEKMIDYMREVTKNINKIEFKLF